ncbi:MAG TPA: class I SAM-dependent methyltransferase [Xanthobacteraceae bacterium]|nr:class I SAM-dependent methyltransferase [Xanthobacteraceae bacterium]
MKDAEFQRWQARYSAPEYVFGKEPNAFLKAHAHLLRKGQTALAVADGEGRNGIFLAEYGLDVLSIDFSPAAQEKARALARERGVTLRIERADVLNWNWPAAAFDVVVAIFIQFAPPAERAKIFAGIKRALKPGGLLLMEGYSPKQLEYKTGGPSEGDQLYTRALLEEAFGDFSSLDIREHEMVLHEGSRHGGMSALIDLVGRK